MSVLVIGATSAIGEQLVRVLAAQERRFYLTARNPLRLDAIADDIRVRSGAEVLTEPLDVCDTEALSGVVDRAAQALGDLDTVIFAVGFMPVQRDAQDQPNLIRQTLRVNATSAIVVLSEAANYFERRGRGRIVAIGSVAGDRGRGTNYIYGAAKASLAAFMSGLRQRMSRSKVKVLLVKPGFVDTPMTAAYRKGRLWATPERVARDVVRALERGRSVIYTPWYWRWIMLILCHIPEPLFLRLRF